MATTNFVLKQSSKHDEFSVYLRISHLNFPAKYLSLHVKVKQNQWDKSKQRFKRNLSDYKVLNKSLEEIETRADSIISNLMLIGSFSTEAFKKEFLGEKENSEQTVKEFFLDKINQLKITKRFGSYRTYSNSFASLIKYTSLEIPFSKIDLTFLKCFETYHINLGNKPNSYAGYFRILRALHYEYCKLHDISQPSVYKRFNISRIKNETRRRSLTKDQLREFINYKPVSEAQKKAQLIFLFSFYARGINLMDLLQLTADNLEGEVLVYRRQKTGKQMRIKLVPQAISILNYFENDSPFLFPYLKKEDIPKFRIACINRNINRRLKSIGKNIGVETLTIYYSRHSFAELNYKAGVRIEIISQMLGHSDLKTTQVYLRSFSDDEVDAAADTIFNSL